MSWIIRVRQMKQFMHCDEEKRHESQKNELDLQIDTTSSHDLRLLFLSNDEKVGRS